MLVLAALCAGSAMTGCRKQLPGNPEPLAIRDKEHYFQVWEEVKKETERPLLMYEENQPLTGDDHTLLQQAHPKVLGLIKHKPLSFPPRVIYAKLLRASNSPDRALPAYLEALDVVPENPPQEYLDIMAECHADVAEIYFGRKELAKAEDELREALRIRPNTLRFMLQLVQVLLDSGQTEPAREQFQAAKKLAPENPGVKSLGLLFESPSEGGTSSSPKPGETRQGSP